MSCVEIAERGERVGLFGGAVGAFISGVGGGRSLLEQLPARVGLRIVGGRAEFSEGEPAGRIFRIDGDAAASSALAAL